MRKHQKKEFDRHTLRDRGAFLNHFSLMELKRKKAAGKDTEPHRHDHHTLLFLFSGTAEHDIDFGTFKAGKRSVHFVHVNSVHLLSRSVNATGVVIMFAETFADNILVSRLPFGNRQPVITLAEKEFQELMPLLEEMKAEFGKDDEQSYAIIRSLLHVLLLKLTRFAGNNDPEQSGPAPRFTELVEKNYLSHLSVEQYADKMNVSPKHLIESIRELTGKTPLKLIHEKLISEAKKLLFFTDLSVKQIADKLNFSEPGNFSKFFRKQTGYTVLEYRKRMR